MADTKKIPEPSQPPKPSQPAKVSGGRRRLIVIALAAVIVVGGGVAAFWATSRSAGAAAASKPAPKPVEHGLVTLEPFVVNLADHGGSRFLRISVRLVVESVAQAEHLQKSNVALTRARSAILDLLTQQMAEHLVTAKGKAELKEAISKKLEPVLEETKVVDVLFSDFVVQF
jgi:flagellar FliL protein